MKKTTNAVNIGILTFHRAMNYGAILQSYALKKVLEQSGCNKVKVIDYYPDYFKKGYKATYRLSEALSVRDKIICVLRWILRFNSMRRFRRRYLNLYRFQQTKLDLTLTFNKSNPSRTINNFDIFIVGSDQVWSTKITHGDPTYFLDFVPSVKKKISYAASFSPSNDPAFDSLVKKYLSSFHVVSVREQNSVDYLKSLGINCSCVLDPTLLLDKKFWEQFPESGCRNSTNKYVLIYLGDKREALLDFAFAFAKRKKFRVFSLSTLKNRYGYKNVSGSSLEEFVGLIRDAECVFTPSFHGLVLSINLHKEFYFETPQSSTNNNERLLDITRKLGLENRNIANGISEDKINWDSVEDKLNVLRKESMDFLYNSIGLNEDEQKNN